jgi:serine/threonine protein kinase
MSDALIMGLVQSVYSLPVMQRALKRNASVALHSDADDVSDEEMTLGSSVDSPTRSSNFTHKKQRSSATWHLDYARSANLVKSPKGCYEVLHLARILTQNCRSESDYVQTVLCLLNTDTRRKSTVHHQVVGKLLATRIDDNGEDRTWCIRTECEASIIMSRLVERHMAPGLIETFGAYTGLDTLQLPVDEGDVRWHDIHRALHTPESDVIERPRALYYGAVVSEFVGGGLVRDIMGALGMHPNMVPASHLIAQLYGQLQWTLAAIHGVGLVHADVQSENVLVRHVPADTTAVFDLQPYGVRYRFLSGVPGSTTLLLKLADYGITSVRGVPLFSVPTARFSRAPEFFGAYNPTTPDARANTHMYTQLRGSADVWSSAMVFMTMLCGGIVPGFHDHHGSFHNVHYDTDGAPRKSFVMPPELLKGTSWKPPRGFVLAFAQQIRHWRHAAHNTKNMNIDRDEVTMLLSENAEAMAAEIWRIAMLLGVPKVSQWPDVAHMPLMKLLKAFDPSNRLEDAPDDVSVMPRRLALLYNSAIDTFAPDMNAQDRADLGTLLAQQLQWNPCYRPKAHVVLKHPIMKRLCRAEEWTNDGPPVAWTLNIDCITGNMTLPEDDPLLVAVNTFSHERGT